MTPSRVSLAPKFIPTNRRLRTSVATAAVLTAIVFSTGASAQIVTETPVPAPQFDLVISGPGGGGPNNERLAIVDLFDNDRDGVLNAEERAAARLYLEAQPRQGGPGQVIIRTGPGPGGPGRPSGPGGDVRVIIGPDGVERTIPIGPDGTPLSPLPPLGGPGAPAAGFGGEVGGAAAVAEPTGPFDEAAITEALRTAVTALAEEDFGELPAEVRATVVECIMTATAAMPIADRALLAATGFEPTDEQIARFDRNLPGVEAAVRACFPMIARVGGPGGEAMPTETGTTGVALTPADVETYAGVPLYDTSVIRTIFLEFGYEDWEAELEAFYNTDVQVPVIATVDGVTYPDVGVRFRGNTSFGMVPAGLKRPIRLKFDFVNEDEAIEGYRTLNLLNGVNDPGFVKLALYSYIANRYIAAPKVNYLRLVVDGENWGVYANQQHFNRDFVADYFGFGGEGVRWQVPGSPGARGGMEYLGDDIEQYRSLYEIDNQDNDESWNALINLFRVLNETPADNLVEALDPILDIDGVLRFLALELVLNNSDGYYARASDYYIYLDPEGRFHVAPHDMNETLSGRNIQLDPLVGLDDETKPLRSKLLAVPELRARYLEYVLDIAENWLDWDNLGPVATAYHDLIDADMARDTRKLFSYDAFAASLTELQTYAEARQAYLLATVPALIAAIPLTAAEAAANAAAIATPAPAEIIAQAEVPTPGAPAAGMVTVATVNYAIGGGPDGWTIAAGEGMLVTDPMADPMTTFAFTALTDGFGDNKLDQCVAIDATQPLEIAYTLYAYATDPAGLAVRINPTFFATPADCEAAVAADDNDAALDGARADEDLDFALGTGDGLHAVTRTAADDAALGFAAAEIPAGATTMRLSVRARDRSAATPPPLLGIGEVTVTQAGTQLVLNPDFTGVPAP